MRKYRVVVRAGGRKHTRHVRAEDGERAREQAEAIAWTLASRPLSGAERAVLAAPEGSRWRGGGAEVLEVTEMGRS